MKWILPAMLALGLVAGTYWAMGGVSGEDYPYRKPGFWEITIQTPAADKVTKDILTGLSGIKMCIDRDTDKLLLQGGGSLAKQLCSKADMKVEGKTIIVETDCTMLGIHTSNKSTTNIRDASFHTETESRLDGQTEPQRMSQDGRWIGPCPSDVKPGDVVMMNGAVKVNMKDLSGKDSPLSQLLR